MSEQKNTQSNTGCVLNAVIIILLLVIAAGVFGGASAMEAGVRQITIYPDISAPAPEQLNYVPSVQVFADPVPTLIPYATVDQCASADPLADYPGWENGVGGQYPPCWTSWTNAQQNAFLRSH